MILKSNSKLDKNGHYSYCDVVYIYGVPIISTFICKRYNDRVNKVVYYGAADTVVAMAHATVDESTSFIKKDSL